MLQPFQEKFHKEFTIVYGDYFPQCTEEEPKRNVQYVTNRVGLKFYGITTFENYVTSSDETGETDHTNDSDDTDDESHYKSGVIIGPLENLVSYLPIIIVT